jgi:hypothetical protein
MAKETSIQETLAGLPGPPKEVVEQKRKLESALRNLHDAAMPIIEVMPEGSKFSFKKKVKGDWLAVTIQPDQEK